MAEGRHLQVKRGLFANIGTLAAGELALATDTNVLYVGDGAANHAVLMLPSGTAHGALLYFSATGVPAVIAHGTDDQVLHTHSDGSTPAWGAAVDASKLPLAGGTMSGDIVLGENAGIALDPAGSADEKWSGIWIDGTAGATLAVGDLCYLDVTAAEWLLADADASASAGPVVLGICILAGGNGQATKMLLMGTVRSAAFPASIALGAAVYVSATAGDITATAPSTATQIVRIVGHAVTVEPNTIYFAPDNTWVEV
jgi:hypothetical protein